MTDLTTRCYHPQELARFLAGKLTAAETPRLDQHLLECATCRKAVENLWRQDQLDAALKHRKEALGIVSRVGAEEAAGEGDSKDDEFLRRTRRLLDRFLFDRPPRPPMVDDDVATPSDTATTAVTRNTPTSPADSSGRSTPAPAVPGLRMGEPIGFGGMGVVYAAWESGTDRPLACKVLSNALPTYEERERFDLEARAAKRLDHPHVIRIESSGAIDDRPYLVMEFAAGGTLQQLLGGKPQPVAAAAATAAKLADALAHAHERGVLHRDLKPSNILLVPRPLPDGMPHRPDALADYDPKIADFSIAKLLDSNTLRTQTGQLLGTPAFAAPEQFLSEFGAVGPAADIYSLGAILYLMLTGLPPLPEDNPRRLLALVRDFEPVPPRQLRPEIPEALETICLCCLEKRPRWRYRNAADLASDLVRFMQRKPISARPRGRWRRSARWVVRNRLITAMLLGLVVLSGVALAYANSQRTLNQLLKVRDQQDKALSAARLEKLASDTRATQFLTFKALDASHDVEALEHCLQVALSPYTKLIGAASNDASDKVLAKLRATSIIDHLPRIKLRMIVPPATSSGGEPPQAAAASRAASVSDQLPLWKPARRQLRFNAATGRLAIADPQASHIWEVDTANGRMTEHLPEPGPLTADLGWRLSPTGDASPPLLARLGSTAAPRPLELPVKPPEAWRRLWISPAEDIALALGERRGELFCYGWRLPEGKSISGSVGPVPPSTREVVFTNDSAVLLADDVNQLVGYRLGILTNAGITPSGFNPVYVASWRCSWNAFDKQDHPNMTPRFRAAVKDLRNFTKATVAAIDTSGSKIALGYANGRVGIIDDFDCDLRYDKIEQLRQPVEKVAFSPDSQHLLAYTETGELLVVNLAEGRMAVPLLPHFHRIVDAAFSPDGRDIAVLDERNLLTVWRLGTDLDPANDALSDAPPHAWFTGFDTEPLIVFRDRWLELWDPPTGRRMHRWQLPQRTSPTSPPDGNGRILLLMPPADNGLRERAFFDFKTGQLSPTAYHAPEVFWSNSQGTERGFGSLLLHPSHIEMWWHAGTGQPEEVRLPAEFGRLYKAIISPTGRELAVFTRDGWLVVWDLLRNVERYRGEIGHPGMDMNARYSTQGETLYVYSPKGLRRWDTRTGEEHPVVEALRNRHVVSIDFHPEQPLAVTMCDNRTVTVWDALTWKQLHSFSPNSVLTEARFGLENGTMLVGMWNLPDADNDRLYLRNLWIPAINDHGHAEMWDYQSGSRISSAFAFRGYGDRGGSQFSREAVVGIDAHYRSRLGQWPTRNRYKRSELIAIGTQFLQRDVSNRDSKERLSAAELVDAWQQSFGPKTQTLATPQAAVE